MRFTAPTLLITSLLLVACSDGGSLGSLPDDPKNPTDEDGKQLTDEFQQLSLSTGKASAKSSLPSNDSSSIAFVLIDGTADDTTFDQHNSDFLQADGIHDNVGNAAVEDFYLMTTELSQAQWSALVDEVDLEEQHGTPWSDVSPDDFRATGGTLPAFGLTDDAITTVLDAWNLRHEDDGIKLRLPTATEWQYAAMGGIGDGRNFIWGDDTDLSQRQDAVWVMETVGERYGPRQVNTGSTITTDGASLPAQHLKNIHGNVWEWVKGGHLRGGSWADPLLAAATGNRLDFDAAEGYATAGVRLVLVTGLEVPKDEEEDGGNGQDGQPNTGDPNDNDPDPDVGI